VNLRVVCGLKLCLTTKDTKVHAGNLNIRKTIFLAAFHCYTALRIP
jgi:hypothetical protein